MNDDQGSPLSPAELAILARMQSRMVVSGGNAKASIFSGLALDLPDGHFCEFISESPDSSVLALRMLIAAAIANSDRCDAVGECPHDKKLGAHVRRMFCQYFKNNANERLKE